MANGQVRGSLWAGYGWLMGRLEVCKGCYG